MMAVSRRAGLACVLAAFAALSPALLASAAGAAQVVAFRADYFGPFTVGGSGGPGKAAVFGVDSENAEDPKLVLDASGLDGVMTLEPLVDECVAAGDLVTCDVGLGDGNHFYAPVALHPVDGVASGATGELTFTTSAANVDEQSQTVEITVLDGVDLIVLGDTVEMKGIKPGEFRNFEVVGANAGNVATSTVQLTVSGSRVTFAQYDNCSYSTQFGEPVAVCLLDIPGGLNPGEGFELADGFGVSPTRAALTEFVFFTIAPGDDIPSPLARNLRDGKGKKLAAHKARVANQIQAVDIDESDNFGDVLLLVDNTADLVARGATVSGDAGEVKQVRLGAANLGPGTRDNRAGDATSRYRFVVPPGTEVATVPDQCFRPFPSDPNEPPDFDPPPPGLPEYWCYSGTILEEGDEYGHTFGLRITDVIPNAAGSVQVIAFNGSPQIDHDANLGNNTAAVLVNPVGNGLPNTGARVALIAGVGAALLVVGTLVLLAVRRRRLTTAT